MDSQREETLMARQPELKDIITNFMCHETVGGWIWYCDNCQTHGNADTSDEAEYMALAHIKYMASTSIDHDMDFENATNEEIESNTLWYRDATQSEREIFFGENEDGDIDYDMIDNDCWACMYILDIETNTTFNYGEDYTQKHSNVPVDPAIAENIRKIMGL
jgi:hypothetical protein